MAETIEGVLNIGLWWIVKIVVIAVILAAVLDILLDRSRRRR